MDLSSDSSDDDSSYIEMEKKSVPKLFSDEKLIKLVKEKIIEKMSVDDLKGICSEKGISGISTPGEIKENSTNNIQTS